MVDPESRIGISRQVASPPAARALSMLSYVDDEGRLVETGPAQDRTERNGSEQSLKTRR
jgi:hypothetical protein